MMMTFREGGANVYLSTPVKSPEASPKMHDPLAPYRPAVTPCAPPPLQDGELVALTAAVQRLEHQVLLNALSAVGMNTVLLAAVLYVAIKAQAVRAAQLKILAGKLLTDRRGWI